jgi:hypothetical protein
LNNNFVIQNSTKLNLRSLRILGCAPFGMPSMSRVLGMQFHAFRPKVQEILILGKECLPFAPFKIHST